MPSAVFLKNANECQQTHYEQEKTKYQNFRQRPCYAEPYIGDCGKKKNKHPYIHVLYICYGWFFPRISKYLKKYWKIE